MRDYPEIDGLRGVLSLVVVAGHVLEMAHWPGGYPPGQSPVFWYWGTMEVFFCISGFLIVRGLIQSSSSSPDWVLTYLKKRALRIWPAYYVALVLCAIVSLWVPGELTAGYPLAWNGDTGYLFKTLVFLQYTEGYRFEPSTGIIPAFGHSWSVAIEEQFYLLILLVMYLRFRHGLFAGSKLALPILLLVPLTAAARAGGYNEYLLLGRLDGFALGILLALAEPGLFALRTRLEKLGEHTRSLAGWVILLAGATAVLPYLLLNAQWHDLSPLLRLGLINPNLEFSVVGLALLACIVLAPDVLPIRLLAFAPLRFLGRISYSTYLFHLPMLFAVHAVAIKSGWSNTAFAICGVAGVMALSLFAHYTVERPFLRLKAQLGMRATSTGTVRALQPLASP